MSGQAQDAPLASATSGGVCTITLNRPAALNSFTVGFHSCQHALNNFHRQVGEGFGNLVGQRFVLFGKGNKDRVLQLG